LWDSSTTAVSDHWKIVRAEDHGQSNKVQLDRLTVFFNGPSQDALASLDESRLDEALLRLFGLATGTETETPTVRDKRPIHLSTLAALLFQQSVRYSLPAHLNGRRPHSRHL
jgi:hypothetical protein